MGPQISSVLPGACPGERLAGPRFYENSSVLSFGLKVIGLTLRAKLLARYPPSPAAPHEAKIDPIGIAMIF